MEYVSRRSFLSSLASVFPLHFAAKNMPLKESFEQKNIMNKLGLHLGCIQNELVERPQQILEFIQNIGIKYLELPDPILLKRLNPILLGMGFQVPATHFPSPYITDNWQPYTAFGNTKPSDIENFEQLIDKAAQQNITYLIFPNIFPQDRGDLLWYANFAKKLNEAGAACKRKSIQLCYHNHSFEFQPTENTSPIEVMLGILDPELVKIELNLFWCGLAGIDIEDFIAKYQAFIALLHLGDLGADTAQTYRAVTLPQDTYKAIGKGKINFGAILNSSALEKVPYYFINLQQSENILDDVKSSVDYLKNL
ncbi:sugar phosphate isomerase/epimerase [Catalinimonas sp. 4WD22]|uniref:sugar phosphate isomerase/epimerase family protein n=1 Tax=Catalinimonas locisalis TaxID=3133978 RepID=UPI003101AB35